MREYALVAPTSRARSHTSMTAKERTPCDHGSFSRTEWEHEHRRPGQCDESLSASLQMARPCQRIALLQSQKARSKVDKPLVWGFRPVSELWSSGRFQLLRRAPCRAYIGIYAPVHLHLAKSVCPAFHR